MGDSLRFEAFADFIGARLPRDLRLADVAAGNGHLRKALIHRGYKHEMIESWDRKSRNLRSCKLKGLFDWNSAPRHYDAVVAMHPDEATDHCILYAIKHKVPFIVCPCCIKPSATNFKAKSYHQWIEFLSQIGEQGGHRVAQSYLSIRGCNVVLAGVPR